MSETMTNQTRTTAAGEDLVITRIFDAPREEVFRAWTEAERMMQWWGPSGFTCPACEIDLRPGGRFLNCMRSSDGQDFWSTGIYREIAVPERLVCTESFADAEGNVISPVQFGMGETWPMESLLRLTFEERDGRTELTVVHGLAAAPAAEVEMCRLGWGESLDKLEAYLAGR